MEALASKRGLALQGLSTPATSRCNVLPISSQTLYLQMEPETHVLDFFILFGPNKRM
jgi:hypothetical protein